MVLFICVNYHCDNEIADLVQSVFKQAADVELTTLVVDNSARNETSSTLSDLSKSDQRCHILIPGTNLGYFTGANWGLQQFLKTKETPNWVIVSNPDIAFDDNRFISQLIQKEYPERTGIIAPSIFSVAQNTDQNPFMLHRPTKTYALLLKVISQFYWTTRIYETMSSTKSFLKTFLSKYSVAFHKKRNCNSTNIFAPHGAFVLFHSRFFKEGGTLEYKHPLFGEEMFLGETAKRLGQAVMYDPSLRVIHREHHTTKKVDHKRKWKLWQSVIRDWYSENY